MSKIEILQFTRSHLPEVLALYERAMGPRAPRYCGTIRSEQLERQYFRHPEFREEGLFVAKSGDEVAGFIFGALRLHPITPDDALPGAFVCMILVDERFRRRGIGSQLLERVAEFGRRHGKTRLSASSDPMNPLAFWPGVNRAWHDICGFLRAHGFSSNHAEVSMDQRLDHFTLPEFARLKSAQLRVEGFGIIPYEARFHDPLLAAAGTPFWHLDLRSKIDRTPHPFIETAFLDLDGANIYNPAEVLLAVRNGDELAGFVVLCRNPGEPISYLGPIRIVDDYRGSGLGSVMIQEALLRERQRGVKMVDLWCSESNAARYYSRNGFIRHDVWDLYERSL
jgi:GNAT superfamily N-acetyltransferase